LTQTVNRVITALVSLPHFVFSSFPYLWIIQLVGI